MSGDAAVQADERCLSNELTGEGLSSSRVRPAHIVLGMALDSAVHDGIIARNTARRSGVKLSEHAAYLRLCLVGPRDSNLEPAD